MKLYTKTGDDGTTGLVNGQRVGKDCPRVEACGAIDALSSDIGLATAACEPADLLKILRTDQVQLFELNADLMTPSDSGRDAPAPAFASRLGPAAIAQIEQTIDTISSTLAPMKWFILPGGGELAARLHVARTTCRLAERRVVTLRRAESITPHTVVYLNRLSDLLFVMARHANKLEGIEDIPWMTHSDPTNVD